MPDGNPTNKPRYTHRVAQSSRSLVHSMSHGSERLEAACGTCVQRERGDCNDLGQARAGKKGGRREHTGHSGALVVRRRGAHSAPRPGSACAAFQVAPVRSAPGRVPKTSCLKALRCAPAGTRTRPSSGNTPPRMLFAQSSRASSSARAADAMGGRQRLDPRSPLAPGASACGTKARTTVRSGALWARRRGRTVVTLAQSVLQALHTRVMRVQSQVTAATPSPAPWRCGTCVGRAPPRCPWPRRWRQCPAVVAAFPASAGRRWVSAPAAPPPWP
jgi:hypothetical protein